MIEMVICHVIALVLALVCLVVLLAEATTAFMAWSFAGMVVGAAAAAAPSRRSR